MLNYAQLNAETDLYNKMNSMLKCVCHNKCAKYLCNFSGQECIGPVIRWRVEGLHTHTQ